MDMAIAVWTKIDEGCAVEAVREAARKLNGADGDVTLDFSLVRRIDAGVIQALEELADRADEKGIKVALRGVNVDVYKVLKLVKLSSRFAFVV
jgi:anti-anti-sigma regulatory factor